MFLSLASAICGGGFFLLSLTARRVIRLRKKKVLVQGTTNSLQEFFTDAVSYDYEVVAILSNERISIELDEEELEVFTPQSLPKFVYGLIDGIIFTNIAANEDAIKFFLDKGLEPRKLILWNAQNGWGSLNLPIREISNVVYFCGLEFHIRNEAGARFFHETFWRFQTQRQVKNLNPQMYPAVLSQDYQRRTGKSLDFNNLRTFTEKLQWLKIFDATPIKSRLADKYLVRNWVAEKIGQEYLIPLLGVWDDFDDIDFDTLPDQFVLKCNHGWNMNVIVRDKKTFDKRAARERLNGWLAVDFGAQRALELHYSRIDRKIIAEKFMANGDLPDIDNYKFWFFDGKPLHCALESGRSADGSLDNLRMDFFDMNWQVTNVERSDHPRSDHPERIRRPKNFKLMKKLAAKLAEGFAFVSVDFYEIEGKVYFGEMTFTPGAGNFYYKSEGTDEYLGGLLKLPARTPPPRL